MREFVKSQSGCSVVLSVFGHESASCEGCLCHDVGRSVIVEGSHAENVEYSSDACSSDRPVGRGPQGGGYRDLTLTLSALTYPHILRLYFVIWRKIQMCSPPLHFDFFVPIGSLFFWTKTRLKLDQHTSESWLKLDKIWTKTWREVV